MDESQLKDLIDKCLTGKASKEEQQALEQWYASFDSKQGLLEQLNDTQKEEIEKRLLSGIHSSTGTNKVVETISFIHKYKVLLVACSIVFIFGISWYFYNDGKNERVLPSASIQWIEIKGLPGKVSKDTLPDGSVVWLNGLGKIRYDKHFIKQLREVWLEGEGYFEVVHQPQIPFRVHAGNLSASVLGTEFNIKRSERGAQVVVTVIEGRVYIESKEKVLGVLGVNDQLSYNNITGAYTQKIVTAASIVNWKNGGLIFKEKPFKEIANGLEIKFNIKVKFANSELQDCLLTASFDPDVSAKDILTMLCKINSSELKIDNNTFIISGKPCEK